MRKLAAILLLLAVPASAANTTPPGVNNQLGYNKNGNGELLDLIPGFISSVVLMDKAI